MPAIQPFNLAPSDPPDVFTAYWRAVLLAAGYLHDNAATLSAVAGLVGATAVTTLAFQPPLPDRAYVIVFPSGALVSVNGTTQLGQFVVQTTGAILQINPFGAGRVNSYDYLAAIAVLAGVSGVLTSLNPPRVLYIGHSLGGAVAQMLAQSPQAWPVVGSWTMGQPRVGTAEWAAGYHQAAERYTTVGDPVPSIPPSRNPLIDATAMVAWPFFPQSYEHTGTRRHVDADGTIATLPELPSWIEGTDYLNSVVLGQTGWFGAHSTATYAGRIRQAIPVPWLGTDPAWPLVGALDALAAPLLGPMAAVPSPEMFTVLSAVAGGLGQYAQEGICE